MENDLELIQRIQTGPKVLLLGQRYLSLNQQRDQFLMSIKKNYFNDSDIENDELDYNLILNLNDSVVKNKDLILGWMQKRCERISPPDWLRAIAQLNWNSVYTSSIDNIIPDVFRNSWREFHPIYSEKHYPSDIRSTMRLHGTFLFGNISRSDQEEIPPFDEFEFEEAKEKASGLLKRLPDLITPFGVLIIEGYNHKNDWLKFKDLYSYINSLNCNQTHIFSCNEKEIESNKFAKKLIKLKKLVVHEEGFSDFLLNAEAKGIFNFSKLIDEEDSNLKRITINGKSKLIPKNIYNNISSNAIVLDDNINLDLEEINGYRLKEEFKNFLLESSIRPVWNGYKRQLNIKRSFEDELVSAIQEEIRAPFDAKTIILHGQAGTGKSVSLGAVAYKFKKDNKFPIIFIEKRNKKPSYESIDVFCKWLEDQGAEKTIIIWDDSVYGSELIQYIELNKYLVTRGRKIVIVGSVYKVNEDDYNSEIKFIEAELGLKDQEIISIKKICTRIYSTVPKEIQEWNSAYDNNFLVALYRLLPITKPNLRKGIGNEMVKNEERLNAILEIKEAPNNILAIKLLEVLKEYSYEDIYENENNDNIDSQIEVITELIMVPGQFGLGVPIELILRVINKGFNQEIFRILEEIDVFRIVQMENGNIEINPRHSVEAQLLVQYRIGNIRTQVDVICKLIDNMKGNYSYGEDNEISFIVELLKQIGPNSKENAKSFTAYYTEITDSLNNIRIERCIVNSRLMLQEATLLREYAQVSRDMLSTDKVYYIKKAELIIRDAIDLENKTKNNKFKSYLYNELATNLGVQLTEYINCNDKSYDLKGLFDDIKDALKQARKFDPDTYHPIDVWAWTTQTLVESNKISSIERQEVLADAVHLFERIECENINISGKSDFIIRKNKLANLCNNIDVEIDTFNKLLELKSGAGIYMKAMAMISKIDLNNEILEYQKEECINAINYIKGFEEIIKTDSRCLYLLLKLTWICNSAKPIFFKEKQTVPFSKEIWTEVEELASKIIDIENQFATVPIKYIKAISLFHLGDVGACIDIFEELRNDKAYGRRRIIASHLASNYDGTPKVYSGSIESYDENSNRGWMYIENKEIRRALSFSGKELLASEISIHSTHDDLNVAFNFFGPYIIKNSYYNKSKVNYGGR